MWTTRLLEVLLLHKATDRWSNLTALPMDTQAGVGAYCGVSTLEQKRRGCGIDIQIRDVSSFAARVGLFVLRFYEDAAQNGVLENRRGLRRLLQDCRDGRVKAVILPSLDRLSRDVRIAENLP